MAAIQASLSVLLVIAYGDLLFFDAGKRPLTLVSPDIPSTWTQTPLLLLSEAVRLVCSKWLDVPSMDGLLSSELSEHNVFSSFQCQKFWTLLGKTDDRDHVLWDLEFSMYIIVPGDTTYDGELWVLGVRYCLGPCVLPHDWRASHGTSQVLLRRFVGGCWNKLM